MPCRYYAIGVQGTVFGIAVDLSALPYLFCPFPGSSLSWRPWSVGPSQLQLRQSEKSCKQRFGASPVGDTGWSQKRCLARPSSQRGRLESEASVIPLWPDLPVGDWTTLSAYHFRSLGRPMSCVLPAWAEPWRGSRSPRDPGFMNLTHVVGQFISECPPLVLSEVSPLHRNLLPMRSIFLINHFCA